MSFLLTTDTSCDVPRTELQSLGIPYIPLSYTIDGVTHFDEFSSNQEFKQFYALLREGAMPVTSQINSYLHEEFFVDLFKKGNTQILHLSLSGGLSNTYNSAVVGAECAMEKCPGLSIRIIDTLSATQAHRALLDKAMQLRKENIDFSLVADTLDALKNNLQVWIFVDDLMHLKRGGRVSGPAAHVGTLLKIKPVLIIDNLGKLTVANKLNGTKKAMSYGVETFFKYNAGHCETLYLAGADAEEKMEEFAQMVRARGFKGKIKKGWIGPTIGAHTGAGTFGMAFFGESRLPNKG